MVLFCLREDTSPPVHTCKFMVRFSLFYSESRNASLLSEMLSLAMIMSHSCILILRKRPRRSLLTFSVLKCFDKQLLKMCWLALTVLLATKEHWYVVASVTALFFL